MFKLSEKLIRISLINLNIVALLGVILRYKIAFALPIISQKNFLHSHSHFSFYGWISQTLFIFLVEYLYRNGNKEAYKKYFKLILANLIVAYLMMVSFALQGYGFFSVTFSTLSIIISYLFATLYFKDLNLISTDKVVKNWFKSALLFNIISSIGTFFLAYLMLNKINHLNWYLGAIYFFLHFQYNGWFFFVIMGLFTSKLLEINIYQSKFNTIFIMFFLSCFGAYFLSVPWLNEYLAIHIWAIISSVMQLIAISMFLVIVFKNLEIIKAKLNKLAGILFALSAIALLIKLILQFISVYPPISKIALSFRPIVIGYLHLVLLGIITIFLLAYIVNSGFIKLNKLTVAGIIVFIFGILFNEILLLVQGVAAMQYEYVKHTNELLFSAALVLFFGIFTIIISQTISLKKS